MVAMAGDLIVVVVVVVVFEVVDMDDIIVCPVILPSLAEESSDRVAGTSLLLPSVHIVHDRLDSISI